MTDSPNTADIVERITRHANVLDGDPRAATWVADLHEAVAIITELRKALAAAATTFRTYEALHRKKGTPEGDEKASNNRIMAEQCEAKL